MKQQLPDSPHDRHEAALIVRLFDGDVSERERTRATDRIADCSECATLYADLAAIATATRLLPTPARPRDFLLPEADAARLGRPAGVAAAGAGVRGGRAGRFGWANVRRGFGGALAALGLAGILLTGASAAFAPASQRLSAAYDTSTGDSNSAPLAPLAASAAPAQAVDGRPVDGGNAASSPEAPRGAQATPAEAVTTDTQTIKAPGASQGAASPGPAMVPAPPAATAAAGDTTAGQGSISHGTSGPDNPGVPSTAGGPNAPSGPTSGPDLRTVGLLIFGLAVVAGLALLAGPWLLGRARRRPRAS